MGAGRSSLERNASGMLQVPGGVSSNLIGLFISDFEVAKVQRVAVISVIACHHE